ncbi:MAG: hypothetical protein PHF86_04815 [Candidatus Nanoarchaeia archaeon]|jgi:hypothetical protein|nr:hypothetical protein [Candidatus Nanoarchaeia archaeon]
MWLDTFNDTEINVGICEACMQEFFPDDKLMESAASYLCPICMSVIQVRGKMGVLKLRKSVFEALMNTKTKRFILCKRCADSRNLTSENMTSPFTDKNKYVCRLCGNKEGHAEYMLPNKEADLLLRKKNSKTIDKLKFRFIQ